MKYVLMLIVGIVVGGGAAIYFLGVPPAKSAPGEAVRAPDQGAAPPATVVIALDKIEFHRWLTGDNFLGAAGCPLFNWAKTMATALSESSRRCFRVAAQTSITLLPEGSGVKTGVQFRNGNIYVPMAFTGSYNLGGCIQFKGWAQNKIKLSFDQEKQVVYGYVEVEGVNLEGVNPIANNFVTVFVQSAINQKVNPLLLMSEPRLQLMIPVKASNGRILRARAKDVRAEVLEGSLRLHLTYDFVGVREGQAG